MKDKTITIRVSKEFKAEIERTAKEKGLLTASYIHMVLTEAVKKQNA